MYWHASYLWPNNLACQSAFSRKHGKDWAKAYVDHRLRTSSDAGILTLQNQVNAEMVACLAHMVTPAHMFCNL